MERLNGIYRGTVIKHLDYGRMKVFIPGVYPDEFKSNPDSLPTAEQVTPIFGGNLEGKGVFSYPSLNSTVVCQFFNGDQNFPIVIGTTQGGDVSPQTDMSMKNLYDQSRIEGQYVHKIHVNNADITFYETGKIVITTRNNPTMSKTCSITLDSDGGILLKSDNNIKIQSPEINLECEFFKVNSDNVEFYGKDENEQLSENVSIRSRNIFLDTNYEGSIDINTQTGSNTL